MGDELKQSATLYRERRDHFAAERDRCAARERSIRRWRITTFLSALALATWAPEAGALFVPASAGGAVLLLTFFGLIVHDNRLKERLRRLEKLVGLNEEGLARLRRDWDALPAEVPETARRTDRPFAADLDLFGRGSLFSLLSVGAPGRETLAAWLLEPAPPETIRARQAAVEELASRPGLREEIAVSGRSMPSQRPATLGAFLGWAEGEPWLIPQPGLHWAARFLPLLPLTLIVLNIAGLVSYVTWVLALVFNLVFSGTIGKPIHRIFDRAFAREGGFQEYAELIRLLETTGFAAAPLKRLRARFGSRGDPAHLELRRLHRLVSLSEVRLSMMHPVIQAFTLWDFHVLDLLEHWQLRVGSRVRDWLEAVAEADALSGLATLRFDQPEWVFPEIVEDGPPTLEAKGLGHPLLRDEARVTNDVTVPPPDRFLFITGSNMSGKSTLLRAIGTNVVLAQAGGPVCASAMRLPPLSLATSMRVHDSLQAGLSHFMAELERLKRVVEVAREAAQRPLLYLLDDILQGTNSAERRIAARLVIRRLLTQHAIGCVTSHDLALAEDARLAAAAQAVHFSEIIEETDGRPRIEFDYRLRPGIATSQNALKLVEMVGLGEAEPDR